MPLEKIFEANGLRGMLEASDLDEVDQISSFLEPVVVALCRSEINADSTTVFASYVAPVSFSSGVRPSHS